MNSVIHRFLTGNPGLKLDLSVSRKRLDSFFFHQVMDALAGTGKKQQSGKKKASVANKTKSTEKPGEKTKKPEVAKKSSLKSKKSTKEKGGKSVKKNVKIQPKPKVLNR